MNTLRGWIVMSWIMLPGAMAGGALLLQRLTASDPDPFRAQWLTAFHAHGGVLIMLSILFYTFLDGTTLSALTKHAASLTLFVGIGAQLAGFLIHAIAGRPGAASIGTVVTFSGGVLMTAALSVLVVGLVRRGGRGKALPRS